MIQLKSIHLSVFLSSVDLLVAGTGNKLWEVPTATFTSSFNLSEGLQWEPHCQYPHLQDKVRITADTPQRLDGTWLSTRCCINSALAEVQHLYFISVKTTNTFSIKLERNHKKWVNWTDPHSYVNLHTTHDIIYIILLILLWGSWLLHGNVPAHLSLSDVMYMQMMPQFSSNICVTLCLDVKFVPVQSSSPAITHSIPAVISRPCSTTTLTAGARTQPTPWWSEGSFVCARLPGSPAEALRLSTVSARWALWSTAWQSSRGWPPGCLYPAWGKWCWGSCLNCTTPEQGEDVWQHWVSPWWSWVWSGWRPSTTVMDGKSRSCS